MRNGGPRAAGGELVAETNAFKPSEYLERVIVKAGGRVFFIKTEEIEWVEAYGNYVRLHVGGAAYLLRETISHLEAQLDPERFARIHRSALANVERIKEMKLQLSGHYAVLMKSGQRLTLSRRYRKRLPKELSCCCESLAGPAAPPPSAASLPQPFVKIEIAAPPGQQKDARGSQHLRQNFGFHVRMSTDRCPHQSVNYAHQGQKTK